LNRILALGTCCTTEWVFLPGVVTLTAGICLAVTLAMGLIGTWRTLGDKAAPHLRNE